MVKTFYLTQSLEIDLNEADTLRAALKLLLAGTKSETQFDICIELLSKIRKIQDHLEEQKVISEDMNPNAGFQVEPFDYESLNSDYMNGGMGKGESRFMEVPSPQANFDFQLAAAKAEQAKKALEKQEIDDTSVF
jgi:hypothetical protein